MKTINLNQALLKTVASYANDCVGSQAPQTWYFWACEGGSQKRFVCITTEEGFTYIAFKNEVVVEVDAANIAVPVTSNEIIKLLTNPQIHIN